MDTIILKFLKLFFGFFIIALGIFFMRQSHLGLNPWGAFHDGLSKELTIKFGTASQLTGLIIIIFAYFLGIKPSIGTLLNMYFCGFFVNLIEAIHIIHSPSSMIMKYSYLVAGLFILSAGICLYLSAGLGAGPRDGLMIGLAKNTSASIRKIKFFIEAFACFMGFVLGGALGIGTVITVVLSGPILQLVFRIFKYDPKETKHLGLTDILQKFN